MNELRYLPNFDIHIGGSRESGRRPMGNGQIANRAICLKLVVLCLQLVFIFRQFLIIFNTFFIYIIGIFRNL